jgi:hypothetical protein
MHHAKPGQSVSRGYLPAVVAGVIVLATLLFNAFSYAALASHPEIGSAFRLSIKHNSPFIESYIWLGDLLRGLPGLSGWGDATANAAAEPLVDRIRPHPRGAAAVFFGAPQSPAHGRMLWAQRMLPFFAIIATILWLRRQKPVHMRQRLRA